VEAGETLLEIAARYGVNYEAILSANPAITPSMLSVGQQLVIPEGGEPSQAAEAVTPQPLTLVEQPCFKTVEGGAWCLALVSNESPEDVEGVVLDMRLISANGEIIAGKEVPAPLNVLLSGGSLPVGNYFPPPLPDEYRLRAELKYAVPYAGNSRYLPVTIINSQQFLAEDGLQAVMKGSITVQNPELLGHLSILAAAYGSGDELLGMRVFQPAFSEGTGGEIPFEMTVYSLAGAIERVELLAEGAAKAPDSD
jgi:LysM repeat protein